MLKFGTINIDGRRLPADLIILDMFGFDVILRIDWLTTCHVNVDCV